MEQKLAGSAVRAVLFDFDGTLTRPEAIDFVILRNKLGCPQGVAILEYIQALGTEDERLQAWQLLEDFELQAARASRPNAGAEELVKLLQKRAIGRGILTRNSTSSVREAMKNFLEISMTDFPVILSRENPGRPKPHPDGVHDAARLFGVRTAEILVVGDFIYDIAAGHAAGAQTAFITNGATTAPTDPAPDYTIVTLAELPAILGL
jgi:HAD superfamily hydrolase (TIGR01509 family)